MWSQDLYQKALIYAGIAHKDQKAKDKNYSYVVHLSSVSMEVICSMFAETPEDPDLMVQCALLHDTIEDTEVKYEDLCSNFGKRVAEGVLALTKNDALPRGEKMMDSLERIRKQPHEIWMIKMADRITNLGRPPESWGKAKIAEYLDEAVLIYNELKSASVFLADRLKHKIEEYKSYL